MPGRVVLEVTQGPLKGEIFTFDKHDVFLFGRGVDCHARLPEADPTVSRHHFLLEVNPPRIRIRDLGSLNGTHVNDRKHGGRSQDESPDAAGKRRYTEVEIKHGDRIRVGQTVFQISVHMPVVCSRCGKEADEKTQSMRRLKDGSLICAECLSKGKEAAARKAERRALKAQPTRVVDPSRVPSPVMKPEPTLPRAVVGEQADDEQLATLPEEPQPAGPVDRPDFPGYVVSGLLGRGGVGPVYLAIRAKDGSKVAIKIMLPRVAVDEKTRKTFLREMAVTAQLKHPNVVELFDQGALGDRFYFVMEYCPGGSVEELMRKRGGKLSVEEAAPIMLQTLEGMAYVHEKGFVHRDLKPRNILLSLEAGLRAKISDLGTSKNFQEAGLSGMTVTGAAEGTPMYMPKEQLLNFKYVEPVSDVWALAATFYEMLTGQFTRDIRKGESPIAVVLKRGVVPIRDREESIPEDLARVIDGALAEDKRARPQTAGEFLVRLREVL